MKKTILKCLVAIASTFIVAFLAGIALFGRQYYSLMPYNSTSNVLLGVILMSIGFVVTLATSIFILKYFIFFKKTIVLDSNGNTLSDNSRVNIGSKKVRPIFAAAMMSLICVIFIGVGFGMLFNEITTYALYLSSIALIFLIVGIVFFLFSVIGHKIRRRFAWITSGICGIIALIIALNIIPSALDSNIDKDGIIAVTGSVYSTKCSNGMLSGPGKTKITIKGTSSETISLRYSGNTNDFEVGGRYTFYYYPNTHFVTKVVPAESISIDNKSSNNSKE